MFLELINNNFFLKCNITYGNLIFLQYISSNILTCININLILYIFKDGWHLLCSEFYNIISSRRKLVIVHPQNCCSKWLAYRKIVSCRKNTASWNINFLIKLDCNRLTHKCTLWILVTDKNTLNMCMFFAWKCYNVITDFDFTWFNLTLESSVCMVRTAYTLYRHIESLFLLLFSNIYIFKICKKCFTLIPRNIVWFLSYIIALCSWYRNNVYTLKRKFFWKLIYLWFNLIKSVLVITG